MNIAVIVWGSVIWDKGSLQTKGSWKTDGPKLPLEFSRIASPGKSKERLALVLSEAGASCVTYWDLLVAGDLKSARNNLRDREGAVTNDIQTFVRNQNPLSYDSVLIDAWLSKNAEIDAVVWSGIRDNWQEVRNRSFSEGDFIDYLNSRRGSLDRINEMFNRTPDQFQTPGRAFFRKWSK